MIRSVLTLRAADTGALEDLYAEHGILARARRFPGCRDALLLRSVDGSPATHLVIADWDTAADYRRWVADPWRVALSRQLAAVLDTTSDEPIVGALFELVPDQSLSESPAESPAESPVSSAPFTPEEHP